MTRYALGLIARSGLSPDAIRSASGISTEMLQNSEGTVPFRLYSRLFPEAVRGSGSEYFWLRPVEHDIAPRENVLWYYSYNSRNIEEALRRTKNYNRLLNTAFTIDYRHEKDGFVLLITLHSQAVEVSNYQNDWRLSHWHGMMGLFAGSNLKLKGVRLTDPSADRQQAHENYFAVPVERGANENSLIYEKGTELLPNINARVDPNLDSILEKIIAPSFQTLASSTQMENDLFQVIREELMFGSPSIADAARKLGMSDRTLQRRLAEYGLTFSGLLQQFRKELAVSYLRDRNLSITDVALMLGYSKVSTFSTVFQKWEGMSPSEFRIRHQK